MAIMPVRRDNETAAFFDGTSRGQFLLIRDLTTGELLDPRHDTSSDRSRYEHVPASGRATVVSWSVPHSRTPDGETLRTVVGIVQLHEGPWWWTEIRGFDPDEDLAGATVRLAFERSGPGPGDESIPVFIKQ
ncbi:putative OB-fold protein [Paenarthrobacter sp. TE4293]|uniref:Zn-ribbon domain-containing OB-fold protein n=1 Tax=Paenarthrobacter sp. TE4293 TaxID=3381695 RepID=UPI003D1B69D7